MATKSRCVHVQDAWIVYADADPIEDGVEVTCTNCDRDITHALSDEAYEQATMQYLDARRMAQEEWWDRKVFEEDL